MRKNFLWILLMILIITNTNICFAAEMSVDSIETSNMTSQKKSVEKFVTDFYQTYLERVPDEEGLKYWTEQIINGKQTPQQVAVGFINSNEYINKNKTNEEYVKDMYLSYMSRTPDEEGYKYWVNQLNEGASRESIINGFENSDEFINKCIHNQVYHKGTADFVERLYKKTLDRNSEPQGKMYWHNNIVSQGKTSEAYKKALLGFTNSPEFVNKNLSREDYVEVLYKTCFNRNSDIEGKSYWLEMITNNYNNSKNELEARNSILNGFTGSSEFEQMIINAQKNNDDPVSNPTEPIDEKCVHNYISEITREATCLKEGEKTYTCSKCNDSYKESISKINHNYVDIVIEPTCTEKGYTKHVCSMCNKTTKDTYINTLGHSWSDWKTETEATEEAEGTKIHTCSRCKKSEIDSIPKKDHEHNYEAVVTEPTCTEQGYNTYTCSKCNNSYKDNYTNALGHSFGEWEVTTPASKDTVGKKERECSRCHKTEREDIPKLTHNHNYEITTIAPTCTEKGYDKHCCSKCGDIFKDNYVDALGHDYEEYYSSEPSCEAGGTIQKKCKYCNKILRGYYVFVDPLGHDYKLVDSKTASCIEDGYKKYKCTVCGDTYTDTISGGEHDWEWQTTKEVSDSPCQYESDFGERYRECAGCHKSETQTIIRIDLGGGDSKLIYGTYDDEEAYKSLVLVNELRTSLGLNELEWQTGWVYKGAWVRAAEIAYVQSHTRPNGAFKGYAENFDYDVAGNGIDAKEAFGDFCRSAKHYENMTAEDITSYCCAIFTDEDGHGLCIQMFQ